MSNESRQDRIDRLKRKFMGLKKVQRLLEYIRYQRARDGELEHRYPDEYVEDCAEALKQMVEEDFEHHERFIEIARKRPSEPFIKAEIT